MKIKLKTLKIPKIDGVLVQEETSNPSSDYEAVANGAYISEMYFYDKTGVIAGERLGTEHLALIPFEKLSKRPIRGDKALVNRFGYSDIDIDSFTWQNDTIVKVQMPNDVSFERIMPGDYVKIREATNNENNGTYKITETDWDNHAFEINNPYITDSSKDEITTLAKVEKFLIEYEVLDIKDNMLSYFEDHYNLALKHRND